jgi:hypothetical protein
MNLIVVELFSAIELPRRSFKKMNLIFKLDYCPAIKLLRRSFKK